MKSIAIVVAIVALACIAGCQRAELSTAKFGQTLPVRSDDAQFVNVELGHWFVTLTPSTIKPGEVHFYIRNVSSSNHAFAIKSIGLDEKTSVIAPGQTMEAAINLGEGDYTIYCPLDGHKDLGMANNLTIQK